ncbi:hypothetical protein BJV82DRAFT_610625 [Fennellomyces sp. T-0311]|nr:hypothetical protein BJV82DRAFT_610625 [Fennellomyces sp. T-0311]
MPPRTPIIDPINESLILLFSVLDAAEVSTAGPATMAVATGDSDNVALDKALDDTDGIIAEGVGDTTIVEYKGRCVCHV